MARMHIMDDVLILHKETHMGMIEINWSSSINYKSQLSGVSGERPSLKPHTPTLLMCIHTPTNT